MGWKCKLCGKESKSDSLNFPIEHELLTGHKEIEPSWDTILRWGKSWGSDGSGLDYTMQK